MVYEILAEGLEAVENDVCARTLAGRTVTLCARISVVNDADHPVAVVRLGVLGSHVQHEVRVTLDCFGHGGFSLSAIDDGLGSIAYGLGEVFGLDVGNVPRRCANTQSWTLRAETIKNRREHPLEVPVSRTPRADPWNVSRDNTAREELQETMPRTLGSLMDSDLGSDITVLAVRPVRGIVTELVQGLESPGASRRLLTLVRLSTDAGFTRTYDSTTPFAYSDMTTSERPSALRSPVHNRNPTQKEQEMQSDIEAHISKLQTMNSHLIELRETFSRLDAVVYVGFSEAQRRNRALADDYWDLANEFALALREATAYWPWPHLRPASVPGPSDDKFYSSYDCPQCFHAGTDMVRQAPPTCQRCGARVDHVPL